MWVLLCLTLATAGGAVVTIVWHVRAGVPGDFSAWASAGLLLGAFVFAVGTLLVRAQLHDSFLYAIRITDAEVEVGGVAGAFAKIASRRQTPPRLTESRAKAVSANLTATPRRARRIKKFAFIGMLFSAGVLCAAPIFAVNALDDGQNTATEIRLISLCCLISVGPPMALCLVAWRDLNRMSDRQLDADGRDATQIAFDLSRIGIAVIILAAVSVAVISLFAK